MLKFLFPFLESFFISIILILILIPIAKKIGWTGRHSKRHIHNGQVFRIGGIAIIAVFNLVIFINKDLVMTPELYALIYSSWVLAVVGIWDDIREIYWQFQLFAQISVAFFIFIMGIRIYYITNPFFGGIIDLDLGHTVMISMVLVVAWVVLVMNSMNWIDGIDGLSGGISFITAGTILFLTFKPEVNQPPIAIITCIFMGAVLAFLVFNFNPARILAGTSGAMFMGFAIAVMAIFSGTKIATAGLVLAVPIMDLLWVIGERIENKKSIFKPDNNHLHHKLISIGWSQKKIVFAYYLITLGVAVIALNTRIIGKSITIMAMIVFMLGVFWWIRSKTLKNIA